MTDGGERDPRERIADYAELHPDAGVVEALGELRSEGVDPAEWRDIVAAALEADDPHAAVATGDRGGDTEGDGAAAPEAGSPDGDPGVRARETGPSPPDDVENDESAEPRDGHFLDSPNARATPDDDPDETDEPLGESDTSSVRHTSGDRDGPETDLNDAASDGESSPTATTNPSDPGVSSGDRERALAAFDDATRWFHAQLDRQIDDHTDGGDHRDRATTAREWFADVRGFDPDTLDEHRLGWAPPNATDELLAYLNRRGHDTDAIRATGLFTEDLRLLWHGRYVFPYFDAEGRPVYAIARCTGGEGGGAAGYDGHPRDFIAGKYAKLAHTKDYVELSEPIFGLGTLDRDGPVLITEGVADAIRAHEHGYACLSPVTTQFKHEHREALLGILDDTDRPVYVVQDAERPPVDYTDDVDGWDALGVEQFGPGIQGAVRTAAYLRDAGVDAYLAELPRPGLDKVDLDDYLGAWSDTLAPVLASARPPEQHPAYDPDGSRGDHGDGEGDGWGGGGQAGDSGRDLTSDNVHDALSHVSNSLPYDDWIRLAYAVHDWDDGARGKRIFKQWSRRSPKWDEPTSPRAIDWIWQNATPGGETTVATLIHRAKQGGWEPPRSVMSSSPDADPVAPFALAKLDALSGPERDRYARKRGLEIPDTDDVRDDLRDALFRELRAGNRTVLDAPTALGKSYLAATTPWRNHADVTGESPVVHLHATTDARDDAAAETRAASAVGATLKGRKERCPVARGDHDPPEDGQDGEDAPDEIVTVDGVPAREWFDRMCDGKELPFSTAHALARERQDQDRDALPCCDGDGVECPAIKQWDGLPRDDDGHPAVDVIHATHQFAYVPSLRRNTNIILDEQPDFATDLGQDRIRRMITAYLQAVDAPIRTWEAFVSLARFDPTGADSDAGREHDAVDDVLGTDPGRDWYVDDPDAHALAPDLAQALWQALRWEDPDANGRRNAKVLHEPPRLDADDGESYAGVWLSVVIDDENTVQATRQTPDFSQARAVVGLDAHPSMPMWELNAGPEFSPDARDAVLDPTERALWRRYERGLTVVQIGDATRPRSGEKAREWMTDERVRTVIERLRDHYGPDFATAIAPVQVEGAVRRILEDVAGTDGVDDDSTMHYGEEKSRNDFADERVGYLYGCMDPGDEMILDTLAELGLDAEPATTETEDGDTVREKGRTFDGPDADTAQAVLASVRENHVAQAAGRYARNPDDPDSHGTVFMHTDACPVGFADLQVPGVEWLATDTQCQIVDALADRPHATTRGLADAVGCTKEHVRQTLARLEGQGLVGRHPGAGDHGADVYQGAGGDDALADLGLEEIANDRLEDTIRWSLAIWNPDVREDGPPPTETGPTDATVDVTGGDPPPTGG